MIQEQAKLIEEKEKEGSSDELRAKDKEIMEASEKLDQEVLAHAAKNLCEKHKIIQEQGNLIKEKEKESSTDGPSAKDKEKSVSSRKTE